MINIHPLYSSSSGNTFHIETPNSNILIDAGVSYKAINDGLASINKNISDISAVIVTHEHSDHIKGLGIFARKYRLPIYANEKTWEAMDGKLGKLSLDQKFTFDMETVQCFNGIDVESFAVSHDAADPMFYTFHHNGKKVSLVTDLGYVSERIKKTVEASDALIFEANHDISMLQMGRYPWSVKRRILGDYGHVSNEDAAIALEDIISDTTKRIYLAHLSKDNNMKDLARMAVEQHLTEKDFPINHGLKIFDTDPNESTALYHLND